MQVASSRNRSNIDSGLKESRLEFSALVGTVQLIITTALPGPTGLRVVVLVNYKNVGMSWKSPKGTSLGESASFEVDSENPPSLFRARRRQKRKDRPTQSQLTMGYISPIWGADPFGQISTKVGMVVGGR